MGKQLEMLREDDVYNKMAYYLMLNKRYNRQDIGRDIDSIFKYSTWGRGDVLSCIEKFINEGRYKMKDNSGLKLEIKH